MLPKQTDAAMLECSNAESPSCQLCAIRRRACSSAGYSFWCLLQALQVQCFQPMLEAWKLQASAASHAQLHAWPNEHRSCRAAQGMTRASAVAVVHQGGLQRRAHQAHRAQVVPRRAAARPHHGLLRDGRQAQGAADPALLVPSEKLLHAAFPTLHGCVACTG